MWAWKLAIGITEFGHWFALAALGMLVLGLFCLRSGWRIVGVLLSIWALIGFLHPAVIAWHRGARLPTELQVALGGSAPTEPALSVIHLFVPRKVSAATMTTEVYSHAGGESLRLDFYRPASGGPTAPCVVVVHGGGWDAGDRTQLPELNHRLASLGYAVASIDYRLMPTWRWPAPREDLRTAIAWLKANATRLGIDRDNLVLLGRSAGAQIVQVVGFSGDDPSIRGVISFYGPSDLDFGYRHTVENDTIRSRSLLRAYLGGTPDDVPAAYREASGINYVTARTPPTLLLHGRLDTLAWYRHDERLEAKLRDAGVPHFYLELPWATHGFDFNPDGPGGQLADTAVRYFLTVVTRSPRQSR